MKTGTDSLVRDGKSQGLLYIVAGESGHPKHAKVLFEYLMELGLYPMMEDEEEKSVLDLAAASDRQAIWSPSRGEVVRSVLLELGLSWYDWKSLLP